MLNELFKSFDKQVPKNINKPKSSFGLGRTLLQNCNQICLFVLLSGTNVGSIYYLHYYITSVFVLIYTISIFDQFNLSSKYLKVLSRYCAKRFHIFTRFLRARCYVIFLCSFCIMLILVVSTIVRGVIQYM